MIRVVNEVMLLGNLVTDPDWKEPTETSQARVWFKFALSSKNPGGKATILDVVVWDTLAYETAENCGKGKELYLHGHLDIWDGKLFVVADEITFGSNSTKQKRKPAPKPVVQEQPEPEPEPDYEVPCSSPDEYDIYDDDSLYVYPEEETEEAPPEEKASPNDRKELATFLLDMGLTPDNIKDMLVKLTQKELERMG